MKLNLPALVAIGLVGVAVWNPPWLPDTPAIPSIVTPSVPSVAEPPADLQSKVASYRTFMTSHRDIGPDAAAYFAGWAAIVQIRPDRFQNVMRLRAHHEVASDLFMAAVPGSAPGFKDAVDSSLMSLFGDRPEATVSQSEVVAKLKAMAWASN